jgi:probable HAF family extracellular repeat protein
MTKIRLLFLAVCICLGLFSPLSSAMAPAYAVFALGKGVQATDFNADGQVVGTSYIPSGYDRAFVTDAYGANIRPIKIDG